MITRLRYVGTSEGGALTQDSEYVVLGFPDTVTAIVIDDNGQLYETQANVTDTREWELASVHECDVQIFPPIS